MQHATITFERSPHAPNTPILLHAGKVVRVGRTSTADIVGVAHETNRAVAQRHLAVSAAASPAGDFFVTVHNTTTSQPVVIEIDGHTPTVLAAKQRWNLARSARILFGRRRSSSSDIAMYVVRVELPDGYGLSEHAGKTPSVGQLRTINPSIQPIVTAPQFRNVVAHCAPLLSGGLVAATDAEAAVILGLRAHQAPTVGHMFRRAIKRIQTRGQHIALPAHASLGMNRTEVCHTLIETGAVTHDDLLVLDAA
jgi:hypothetical protein